MKKLSILVMFVCFLKTSIAQKDTAAAEQYILAARITSNKAIAKKDIAAWQNFGKLIVWKSSVMAV